MSRFFDILSVLFFIALYLVGGLIISGLILGLAVLQGFGDVAMIILGLSLLSGIIYGILVIIKIAFFE